MPPKKGAKGAMKGGKKGGKKAGKKTGGENDLFQVTMKPVETMKRLECIIEAMERELDVRTEEVQRERAATEELRSRVISYTGDLELEKLDRRDIATDFSRMYKARQDFLCEKINGLENTKAELLDQIELQRIAIEELKKDQDRELELRDKVIAEQKAKIQAVTEEFQDMLKDTLNRLVDKVSKIEDANLQAGPGAGPVPATGPAAPAAAAVPAGPLILTVGSSTSANSGVVSSSDATAAVGSRKASGIDLKALADALPEAPRVPAVASAEIPR